LDPGARTGNHKPNVNNPQLRTKGSSILAAQILHEIRDRYVVVGVYRRHGREHYPGILHALAPLLTANMLLAGGHDSDTLNLNLFLVEVIL
jgi:hypothetical protein